MPDSSILRKSISTISTEEQIISYLQKRDQRAVELIYTYYGDTLFGVVLKIVKSQEEAEDILQECLVKMWRYGPDYDASKGRLFTWMVNICRYRAFDLLKSKNFKKSKQTLSGYDEAYGIEEPDSFNPEVIGVNAFLDKLPDEHRAVIDLAYFQGYTQKEISEELGMPLGSVKSKVRSAMKKLRKLIED